MSRFSASIEALLHLLCMRAGVLFFLCMEPVSVSQHVLWPLCSELARTQPQNGCPEREWLPEECVGSLREKSKKVYDHCEVFFAETGYSQDLLRKCGIIAGALP